MSEYASIVFVYRYTDAGTLQFLEVANERKIGDIFHKAPGGNAEPEDWHSTVPEYATALRELSEETGLTASFKSLQHIHTDCSEHRREFFLAPFQATRGELRTQTMRGKTKYVHPPVWRSVDWMERNLVPSQQAGLRRALEELAVADMELAMKIALV